MTLGAKPPINDPLNTINKLQIMDNNRKGSKKVVIYEHPNGAIFIHPTTREPSGKHKTNSEYEVIWEMAGWNRSRDSAKML